MAVDLLGAFPFEAIASAITRCTDADQAVLEALLWLQLLRAFRGFYMLRRMREMRGANVVRVIQTLVGFLIFAHYRTKLRPVAHLPTA